MKKSVFLLLALTLSLSMFSQKTYRVMGWKVSKDVPLNEVKVNLPFTIFASYPEISYERILDTDISVGASLGVGLDKDRYPINFAFSPYFRWFFGGSSKSMERAASGFFIEVNSSVYSRIVEEYPAPGGTTVDKRESEMGAGLGFALGWKYLSKNNWVGEVYGGVGRNFIKSDYEYNEAYPRFGLSIGKRF